MEKFTINRELLRGFSETTKYLAEEVKDALNNGEYENLSEAIWDMIDCKLTWTEDKWDVLRDFCTPENVNYDKAIDNLYSLLWNAIKL